MFSTGGTEEVEACLEGLDLRVQADMNQHLLAKFTALEVETAMGQMGPLKSSGSDGYATCFFQKSWSTVGDEVCRAILNFLNNGMFDPIINHTYIALIPKKKNPCIVTKF
jgi:hypothetical protein